MKKLISFLTALSVVTPCVANAAIAYGGVDSNGTVNSSNASLVLQDYASVSIGGQTTLDPFADVNQDGNGQGVNERTQCLTKLNCQHLTASLVDSRSAIYTAFFLD